MKGRFLAVGTALAVAVVAPASAVATQHAFADHVTVSGAAPSVSIPSTSPSTGSSGSGSSGSSGSNGSGSNDSGSNGSGGGTYGGGSSGSGGSGGYGFGPWSQTSSSQVSGTPVSSWPGVVMVDTVLTNGEGAGTGIVLTSGGIVLTNYHVVEGSTSIRVKANGKTYTAKVLGSDETHDVAVIKLQGASGLKTASLDTSKAILGEKVTAVGQGGGLGTLYKTSGTVTATNQRITASDDGSGSNAETLKGLLQTNAQIVPGYSGGPLVDSSGEVIGMDTAASSGTPVTGYAIPISSAVKIANQIEAGTKTSTVHIGARAALGVEISTQSSTGYGYGYGSGSTQTSGAAVVATTSGGAAAAAGITAGSTITGIDGTKVTGASTLTNVLETKYPGDKVSVTWVDAQGQSHTATVTLGTSPEN